MFRAQYEEENYLSMESKIVDQYLKKKFNVRDIEVLLI